MYQQLEYELDVAIMSAGQEVIIRYNLIVNSFIL